MDCTDSTVIQAIMEELDKKETFPSATDLSVPNHDTIPESIPALHEEQMTSIPADSNQKNKKTPVSNRQCLLDLFSNIKKKCSNGSFLSVVKNKIVAWLVFFVVVLIVLTPSIQNVIACRMFHFNAVDSIAARLVLTVFATIAYAIFTLCL